MGAFTDLFQICILKKKKSKENIKSRYKLNSKLHSSKFNSDINFMTKKHVIIIF